jgi:hypothetical protein
LPAHLPILSETIGVDVCLIDNVCFDKGDAYSYRKSRRETFVSECRICEPTSGATSWSIKPGFHLLKDGSTDEILEPPDDCRNITDSPTLSPDPPPTTPLVISSDEAENVGGLGGEEPSRDENIAETFSAAAISRFPLGVLIGSIAASCLI